MHQIAKLSLLLVVTVSAICIVGAYRYSTDYTSLHHIFDDFVYDAFSTLNPTSPTSNRPNIVVVTINEETLALFPYRSPINRKYLATLLRTIDAGKPRTITFDILFDQATEAESDKLLHAAIQDSSAPIIMAWGNGDAGLSHKQISYLNKFSTISEAHIGFANLVTDQDGTVRKFSNTMGGTKHLSLAAATQMSAEKLETLVAEGRIEWTTNDNTQQPFTTFSAQAVMQLANLPNHFVQNLFEGKYVIVGAELPQQDRHAVSTAKAIGQDENATIAGVFIHAHILNQLIERRIIGDIDDFDTFIAQSIIVVLALLVGGLRIQIAVKFIIATAALMFIISLSAYFFYTERAFYPIFSTIFLFMSSGSIGILYRASKEHTQRDFLRHAFGQYVSLEILKSLESDPESLIAEARKVRVTILFTDIEKFTSFSETTEPNELKIYLNRYLDGVGDIIINNNGLIDKFIGDAVVAIFGAPSTNEQHRENALQCAYHISAFTEQLKHENSILAPGSTRIGVHSGEAMLGNFGGAARFDYTAIGDSVNIAARLESANKQFNTSILFSEFLLNTSISSFSDGILYRKLDQYSGLQNTVPIGRLILKGRTSPILCFTTLPHATSKEVSDYVDAFADLDRKQNNSIAPLEQFAERSKDSWLRNHSQFLLDNCADSTIIYLDAK